MLIVTLLSAVALAGGDPDGVVETAPSTPLTMTVGETLPEAASPTDAVRAQAADPHGLTTDQQIQRWITARSEAPSTWVEPDGARVDDRKMHGEVSVSVGTGGFRQYGAGVSMPIGESTRLDLHFSQTKNSPWAYYDQDFYDTTPFIHSDPVFPARGSRALIETELESRFAPSDLRQARRAEAISADQ